MGLAAAPRQTLERESPIQALTKLNVTWLQWSYKNSHCQAEKLLGAHDIFTILRFLPHLGIWRPWKRLEWWIPLLAPSWTWHTSEPWRTEPSHSHSRRGRIWTRQPACREKEREKTAFKMSVVLAPNIFTVHTSQKWSHFGLNQRHF